MIVTLAPGRPGRLLGLRRGSGHPLASAKPRVIGRIAPQWDAIRYHSGMTTQIAVRLPDELVAFLDEQVAKGTAASRAALVTTALEREMRRVVAQHDAAILQRVGAVDDLDALVRWSTEQGHLAGEG